MSEHRLRRLVPFAKTGMYLAECTQDDYQGVMGSPALVGRDFYTHQDEMNARPVYTNALTELPEGYEHECLLCLRPGIHRFAVADGPDGWLCDEHKDDPVGGWGEVGRR